MAASIFGKDPSNEPSPDAFVRERIEKETAHLKKPQSTRGGPNERKSLGIFVSCVFFLSIAGLYVMDPLLYSWYKGDAVQDYLYLHNCDSDEKARALVPTGILTQDEVEILTHRQGTFQDYYSTHEDAEKMADSIISFMNGLTTLRSGSYDALDPLGKIRYNLFCRWGLIPPTEWNVLNPTIKDQSQ